MSVEIIPAILPRSLQDLSAHLERIRGVARKVQIDLYEGGLWGLGRTWPLRDKRSFEKMLKDETGLPFWTEFDFELDLMVTNSKDLALTFVGLHASRVIVHASFPGAVAAAQTLAEYEDNEHATPPQVGVALGAHASPDDLLPFDGLYDFVQVMGIARVGAQGRPFDDRALSLVRDLRRKYPDLSLQVDGGVAMHAKELAAAGANRLIVGAAIVKAENPAEAYKRLYNEANG